MQRNRSARLGAAPRRADADSGRQHRPPRATAAFAHVELPIPRDRLLHLGVGSTLLFLALAATLAHAVARPTAPAGVAALAWLPVVWAVPAACAAFVLALRRHPGAWAYRLHGILMVGGVVVGGVGALLHAAAVGRLGHDPLELFGSATLAPLTLAGTAVVGWITAWSDEAVGAGRAPDAVVRGVAPAVPGRRLLLWLSALGFAAVAVVGAVDHGGDGLRWTEGVGLAAALWSTVAVVATAAGAGGERWKTAYVGTMLGDVVVGFLGLALHLSANLDGPPEALIHRMVLEAPLAAPLLFGLLGMLGMLAVAEPAADPSDLEAAWPPRRRRRV